MYNREYNYIDIISALIVIQVIIMSLFRCVAIMCFYALKAVRQSLSENLCATY